MPETPIRRNGGSPSSYTYADNRPKRTNDPHHRTGSAACNAASPSDRAQNHGQPEKKTLYQKSGNEPRIENAAAIEDRLGRFRSASNAMGLADASIELAGPEPPAPSIMVAPLHNDGVPSPHRAALGRRESLGTFDLNDPDASGLPDADSDVGAQPDPEDAKSKAPDSEASDALPKFVSENPKMRKIWSAVNTRLAVPSLNEDNSVEGKALKTSVDKYHGALDELKKDISDIKSDAKSAKKTQTDSKSGGEELHQLQQHLRSLQDMNEKLAAVSEDDFPGNNGEYQVWKADLQNHRDAFDSLMRIVQMIVDGKIIAALHDDDHDKDEGKHGSGVKAH